MAQSTTIQALIAHARRQMDQVERRLLKGETIAHDEKVFSIFEEPRWVSKGKAGCAVELGVPVCVVEDQYQFILHHKILWEGAIPILRCRSSTRRRHCIATYGCAASTVGSTAPATGRNSTPCSTSVRCRARVGFSVAEREREQAQAFAEARRQHPAVESAINNLEHRGLDRVRSHGADGFAHPLHCRYWPPTCTASVYLCDGACVSRTTSKTPRCLSAAISCGLRPPGPAHRDGNGLRAGSRECGPV